MGCFPTTCLFLSLLAHIQRSPPVPLLSSLVFKSSMEETVGWSCSLHSGNIDVHLEAVKEELFHADWECARKKERHGLMLSPSSSSYSSFSSTSSFSFPALHIRTRLFVSKLCRGPLPLAASAVNSLQHPQRQEVEKRDGNGGGEQGSGGGCWYKYRMKKERKKNVEELKKCIPGWMRCLPKAGDWRNYGKKKRSRETQK